MGNASSIVVHISGHPRWSWVDAGRNDEGVKVMGQLANTVGAVMERVSGKTTEGGTTAQAGPSSGKEKGKGVPRHRTSKQEVVARAKELGFPLSYTEYGWTILAPDGRLVTFGESLSVVNQYLDGVERMAGKAVTGKVGNA